jgi:hypothetical protein
MDLTLGISVVLVIFSIISVSLLFMAAHMRHKSARVPVRERVRISDRSAQHGLGHSGKRS